MYAHNRCLSLCHLSPSPPRTHYTQQRGHPPQQLRTLGGGFPQRFPLLYIALRCLCAAGFCRSSITPPNATLGVNYTSICFVLPQTPRSAGSSASASIRTQKINVSPHCHISLRCSLSLSLSTVLPVCGKAPSPALWAPPTGARRNVIGWLFPPRWSTGRRRTQQNGVYRVKYLYCSFFPPELLQLLLLLLHQ